MSPAASDDPRLILDENLVLAAGAGSGKTHALVTVALGLYGGGGNEPPLDPARVWIVTFTERAAAELLERVAARVENLANGGEDRALMQAVGDLPRMTAAGWNEVRRSVTTAPIGTFHSLCARLLRRYATEAGIDPRFEILDQRDAAARLERVQQECLLSALSDDRGGTLRLVHDLGSLDAVRATMSYLFQRLIEEGRAPLSLIQREDDSLRPEFDAASMHARIDAAGLRMEGAIAELAACEHARLSATVDTIARERSRLLRCDRDHLGEWYSAVAAVATTPRGRGPLPKEARAVWEPFQSAWQEVQAAAAAVAQAEIGGGLARLLEQAAAEYAAEKRAHRVLDFADLIDRTRGLLLRDLAVRREVKAEIGALLVDEFQDTNGPQMDLLHLLGEVREREDVLPPGGSAHALSLAQRKLCVVGDRKQSIYEFRGADVALFVELAGRARAHDGWRLATLNRSHRSRPSLVAFANSLFADILGEARGEPYHIQWIAPEDALIPTRPEEESGPAVLLLEGDGELPGAERRPFEADLVARFIAKRLSEGAPIPQREGSPRAIRGGDIAVLFRAFSHLELYRSALRSVGIRSVVVGGRGFYRSREVRDLALLLRVIANPFDRLASAALLRSPVVGLSDDSLLLLEDQQRLALEHHARGCAAELPSEDAARLQHVGPLIARLGRTVDQLGAAETLRRAIDELDLLPLFAALPDGEQRLANTTKLITELESIGSISAAETAARILSMGERDDDREPTADVTSGVDPDAVRILTVHAAKGLEFPVVVLPELGAEERRGTASVLFDRRLGMGLRPLDPVGERIADEHATNIQRELTKRREAESVRLLYVAVTRAREQLVLCGERRARREGSWRALIDRALPSISPLIERLRLDPSISFATPCTDIDPPLSPLGELADALHPTMPPARQLIASTTLVGEFARCPLRYYYRGVIGFDEPHRSDGIAAPLSDGIDLDPQERGTLAHLIMERIDLTRAARSPDTEVQRVGLLAGYDLRTPPHVELAANVTALLKSELGLRITAPDTPRLYRELPFALEARGAAGSRLLIKGQIDLLLVDRSGVIDVIDYKYARQPREIPEAYRFQLRTYALAARRVLGGAQLPLRTGIVWLRDPERPPALHPVSLDELSAHETRLGDLAEELTAARAAHRYPKLSDPSACGDCEYRVRCWGSPHSDPPLA